MSINVTPVPMYNSQEGKWDKSIEYYLHNEEDSPLTNAQIAAATGKNWAQIKQYGNIKTKFMGFTDQKPNANSADNKFIIGFLSEDEFKEQHGSRFWAWANVWWAGGKSSNFDANISFNPAKLSKANPAESFRGILLHEMLHTLGIDHTNDNHSIMANVPYNSWRYQGLLKKPDMDTLRIAYPGAKGASEANAIVDEALNFYLPSITHPTTGEKFWATLKHSINKGVHEITIQNTGNTYGEDMSEMAYFNSKQELVMNNTYYFGQKYNLKFKQQTSTKFILIDARLA